ncbi:MAG: DUF4263 domain-containing protein [Chitinophagaceae bacterium]|nr:DUF4263 domain-containing protein [Chitinophagaceae bacterium]
MREVKTSKKGVEYLRTVIIERPLTITRAALWKIKHTNSGIEEVQLKIGRYKKNKRGLSLPFEDVEISNPKSELTLSGEEFDSLIKFLQENYEPFKNGVRKYVPVSEQFHLDNVEYLRTFFANPEKQKLLEFIVSHDIIPQELLIAFNQLTRVRAVERFEEMLDCDLDEHHWQKWFTENCWVLGTDFVKILGERKIDTNNISDFLMQAYDGFVDIVEIKRPDGNLKLWSDQKDHGNYVPHQDLIKAVTQASNYIYEIEQEANSIMFLERVDGTRTIKPRCILIFGRSYNWNDEQKKSYRILNSSYHNLTILTYDHILERASRMVNC